MSEAPLEKKSTATLETLAAEINAEHRAFGSAFRKTLEHGIRAGELLSEAKSRCKHGEWLPWLQQNFEGAPRTAQDYMRLYNHRDEIRAKTRDSAHLSIQGALKEIAELESAHPFFELVEFVRQNSKKAVAEAEVDIASLEKLETKFWDGVEDPLKITALEAHGSAARVHMIRGNKATMNAYVGPILGVDHVEAMWTEHGEHDMAAGWLREFMISMGNSMLGEHGQAYQSALWMARSLLLEHDFAPDFQARVESRLQGYQTVTCDLTPEERTVLGAIAPDHLAAVDEAWEEDKEYELAMRKLETFTRPADIPPSRELGGLKDALTEEQMQMTFSELRDAGVF